ncbi:hypothetical protein [Plasticicumulans lactativorans]|uniref:hypothetical protein n=1 Tax=Plasticicumulans lactativorans TaxID=1133106 RepID=UPI001FB1ADF0|nr:hypothetical protein [Plasticicumulans lactativorans]
MWLILIPSIRNGMDNGPRMGIGTCMCCQQPLQILDGEVAMGVFLWKRFGVAGASWTMRRRAADLWRPDDPVRDRATL